MRFLKLFIISIIIIFGIITAMGSLIPSQIRISRAINLNTQKGTLLSFLRNESQWEKWHPIYQDTAALRQWSLISKTPIENTDSTFVLEMEQQGRKTFINGWQVYEYKNIDSITLQWYMDFKLRWYPWEKFSSLFYESTYGAMMEQGLTNMKSYLHKFPE